MAFEERLGVECRKIAQAQFEALQSRLRDALLDLRVRVQRLNGRQRLHAAKRVGPHLRREQQARALDIEAAAEIDAHPDRPCQQSEVEREPGRYLVEQRERIVSLAVDLV